MGAGGELVGGGAGGVASGKQTINGGHVGIAPEILWWSEIFGTTYPGTGSAGVGTDEIRLCSGDL